MELVYIICYHLQCFSHEWRSDNNNVNMSVVFPTISCLVASLLNPVDLNISPDTRSNRLAVPTKTWTIIGHHFTRMKSMLSIDFIHVKWFLIIIERNITVSPLLKYYSYDSLATNHRYKCETPTVVSSVAISQSYIAYSNKHDKIHVVPVGVCQYLQWREHILSKASRWSLQSVDLLGRVL